MLENKLVWHPVLPDEMPTDGLPCLIANRNGETYPDIYDYIGKGRFVDRYGFQSAAEISFWAEFPMLVEGV